jgi:hypothetical protein
MKNTMKIFYSILLLVSFLSAKPQDVPTKKLRQHSAGIMLGTNINNFTAFHAYRIREYMFSGFYRFNRFQFALGFAFMKNPNTVAYEQYFYGPGVSISGDVISYKKIRVPLSLYLNYYRRSATVTDGRTISIWQNRGAKTGIDYTPFKFPLTVYLYGGVNFLSREYRSYDLGGNVYTSNISRIFGVIDVGLKYSVFRKQKS